MSNSADSVGPQSEWLPKLLQWTRRLVILVTVFVCLLAVMQVAGRLALHSIEWLRPQINQSLLPLRAEVVGAAGDWQGFNPVLRAERVVFPAGNLRNVYVELDFFRSVLSGSWVLRRFYSQSGEVVVVHSGTGWQLKNSQDQPLNIDFQQIVNASEFLDSSFDLVAERSGKQFQYEVSLSLVNDRQKIQGRASVLSPIAQSKRQQLSMTYKTKRSPDSVPDRDQSLKDTWFEAEGQLVLPSGLLEVGGLTLDVSRGHWWGYDVCWR